MKKPIFFLFFLFFFILILNVNAVTNTTLKFNDVTASKFGVDKCYVNGTCIYHDSDEFIILGNDRDWIIKIVPQNNTFETTDYYFNILNTRFIIQLFYFVIILSIFVLLVKFVIRNTE